MFCVYAQRFAIEPPVLMQVQYTTHAIEDAIRLTSRPKARPVLSANRWAINIFLLLLFFYNDYPFAFSVDLLGFSIRNTDAPTAPATEPKPA